MLSVADVRYGTAAQATASNPILNKGAQGIEADTGKFKIGDGVTAWVSLPYVGPVKSATVAASAAINTTETIIGGGVGTEAFVPANSLKVGSTIKVTILGTNTSSVGNASTFRLRMGPLGTIAETVQASAAITSAASGTTIPFKAVLELTVRTIGATGTLAGSLSVQNQGTTGIFTAAANVVVATVAALDTTVNNYLTVTYQSAAATTTSTIQNVIIEVVR